MTDAPALSAYVGIPFADRGRTRQGCDCWGLLRLVLAELRGVELPSFAEDYVTAADRAAIASLIGGHLDAWQEVPAGQEQAFDGILMRGMGGVGHVGLVVRPGLLLHVEGGQTSCIERYRTGLLAQRVRGFYRYAAASELRVTEPSPLVGEGMHDVSTNSLG